MTSSIQTQVLDKIKEYSTIIIHRHVFPDPDALGSQCGLKKIIKESFPSKNVYVVGEEVEELKFIHRMDSISDNVYKDALVIVCDTANLPRICDKRFELASFLIKIDHHPDLEPYGNLSWVDTSYSSTSEMIMDLFTKHKHILQLKSEAARLLYIGIVGDTGRFLYRGTTTQTMKYTAELMTFDFNPQLIFSTLYKKDNNTARLQGTLLLNYERSKNGVAHFRMTRNLLEQFGVDRNTAGNLINTLADIEGNKVWVLFIEYPDSIRVRISSAGTVINNVAYRFNGGGHPLASGATVHSWEEADALIQALDATCKEAHRN
ncbi:bifunctional oligoribonuclease/PAP phosphatase NrnA [Priestia megaterium]|uniref:DHH family phosphoesterase n=1 Tax=Priestia megaterium TaxID=1404 RepID=UPI001E105A1D|nr:bifunctional oligoribonuclease/PAP phosphatase NrnA [Priestia megaterium]